MDKTLLPFIALAGIIIGLLTLTQFSESSIPPTPAFSKIFIGGQTINATSYSGNFTIVTLGDITSSVSDNTITIKLKEKSCDPLQFFNGIDSNGNLLCG